MGKSLNAWLQKEANLRVLIYGFIGGVDVGGYRWCWQDLRRSKSPGPVAERTSPLAGMDGSVWPRDVDMPPCPRKASPPFSQTQACAALVSTAHPPQTPSPPPPLPGLLTDDDEDHAEELNARAQQGAEDHGVLGGPEDVAMH